MPQKVRVICSDCAGGLVSRHNRFDQEDTVMAGLDRT